MVEETQSFFTSALAAVTIRDQTGSVQQVREQLLPTAGEPQFRWEVWYRMFQDCILGEGYDQLCEPRRLALIRGSLCAEVYLICRDMCTSEISYDGTVTRLANRFQPDQSAINSRTQFNRRYQHVGENCLQVVTELPTLAARCRYATTCRRTHSRSMEILLRILMIFHFSANFCRFSPKISRIFIQFPIVLHLSHF